MVLWMHESDLNTKSWQRGTGDDIYKASNMKIMLSEEILRKSSQETVQVFWTRVKDESDSFGK